MYDETTDPRPEAQEPQGEPTAGEPTAPETTSESVTARLEEAERERRQYREIAQRAQADLANYRRRVDEEREDVLRNASARIVVKLLPVLDEMRLAVDHAEKQGAQAAWLEGVRMVQQKLEQSLESEGLERVAPLGKHFDPWEHEALLYEQSETAEEGTIVEVVRYGYKLQGKLLRPAQVAVAKASERADAGG